MKNTNHRKRAKRMRRRYKRLAAALAGAFILSSASLPGLPAATAHAHASPSVNPPAAEAQTQSDISKNAQTAGSTKTGAPSNYKQVLNVKATAYAPGWHDNQQWGNKTYLGTNIRPGVIAVDPRVIPLGSRVYIEYPDGTGTYAIAEDTGGAIKGKRIDVAVRSVPEAYKFGIQNVKVYVLDKVKPV